jgi:hypothetical protein
MESANPVSHADSDEAGQVFQFEAGHPYRFEAGHCTEVMSARLRRSPRVDGMMRSARWPGQERALDDSVVETLPFGHIPLFDWTSHPFVPTCATKGSALSGRSRCQSAINWDPGFASLVNQLSAATETS